MIETRSAKDRIEFLKELLLSGISGTQEEISEKLDKKGFEVTQSTVSRDLRKLGATKSIDDRGRAIYRLMPGSLPISDRTSLRDLILSIEHNESLIVIRTTTGSASLVAAQIDHLRPQKSLGTLAGDDTVFVAPASQKTIKATIAEIQSVLF